MSLIYRILYLSMALAGGYALLVVILNMLPVWPLPSEVSAAVVYLKACWNAANWLLPVDSFLSIFVLSLLVQYWMWFWHIIQGIYRVVVWLVAGSGQATTGSVV